MLLKSGKGKKSQEASLEKGSIYSKNKYSFL